MNASRRQGQLLRFLREQIATRLLLDDADIDVRAPLMSLGMSSLQVMEVKMLLERELALALPSSLIFDYPTLAALAPRLLQIAGLDESEDGAPVAVTSLARPGLEPQANVAAELAAELASLGNRS